MRKLAGGCAATIIATPVLVAVAFMAMQPELFASIVWRMFWTFVALCGLVIFVLLAILHNRRERRDRTYRDGSLPTIRRRVRVWRRDQPWPLALWILLRGDEIFVNPNLKVGDFRITALGEVFEHTPAAGWDHAYAFAGVVQTTHNLQAVYPGDSARENMFGRDSLMPRMPTARAFTSGGDRLALPEPSDEIDDGFAPVEPLRLTDALAQSTPAKWVIGQNDAGQTLSFDPTTQQNIGVIGATGTGKTTSSGYQLLIDALKFGWHPIILDPKGGTDLSMFDVHCEWNATDADKFGEQMALIRQEHEQRAAILRHHQAPNIDALRTKELPHILVFCEEYGDMWEQITASKKQKEIDRIDHDIDSMMRTSRMTGIHFCFVDQFPEKWSQQVFSATKMRLVYQVAPGQDSFLREYKADALPDRGAFMYRRQVWQPWHVEPELKRLLFDMPMSGYPRVIEGRATVRGSVRETVRGDGESVRPVVDTPPTNATNANDVPKWEEFTRDWLQNNQPSPSALARAMAAAEGDVKPYERYKGVAAQMIDKCKPAQPATALDQLRAMGIDPSTVALPSGGRLGVDVSYAMGGDD